MELNIRRYKPQDGEIIWELHKKALKGVNAYIGSGKWDEDMKDVQKAYIQSGGEFLIGALGAEIVAIGALKKLTNSRAEIKRMRVEPELQGRGFGQAILSHLEQRARELSFTELQLDTMVIQLAAQKLYEKNNFREFKRAMLGGHECIFYEKSLS